MSVFGGLPDFPPDDFNDLIAFVGNRVTWRKSHRCACVVATGTPDINCNTCKGFGRYWDAALGPFVLGMNFTGAGNVNLREPGFEVDPNYGEHILAEPLLVIPYTPQTSNVWAFAGEYDTFTQIDATIRLEVTVRNASDQTRYLPQIANAVIDTVQVYDARNHLTTTLPPANYSVVNGKITLGSQYPANEPFIVSYRSSPTYVAFGSPGGLPHIRGVVAGETAPANYPRRLRLKALDQWLRDARTI